MADQPLLEPVAVPDTFCSGIGAVEYLVDCLRLYFYVTQTAPGSNGPQEKVVVAKLIFPASVVPAEVLTMLAAAGVEIVRAAPLVEGALH